MNDNRRLIWLDEALQAVALDGMRELLCDQLGLLASARNRLMNLPTAIEIKCGEWEVNYDATLGEPIYKCSVCKEEWVTLEGGPAENLWNYCPHCGAKMDSIVEDTEEDDWDSYCADHCYECQGYGDDYRTDEDGELVSACDDCPYNGRDFDDD